MLWLVLVQIYCNNLKYLSSHFGGKIIDFGRKSSLFELKIIHVYANRNENIHFWSKNMQKMENAKLQILVEYNVGRASIWCVYRWLGHGIETWSVHANHTA